ncbi:uncharacterized protein EV154DRAFT_484729 [Mucor mucedo]|uniref:uncharacterized protein n=1 Tax=Mucor mucedo TaxID=29922 RepID=UPI00221ECDC8|nr:uncharacterized protein EV154DRAFT_484729 [Mucor mucedo]KAI7887825.1 hypothetical protein EV154DRAFT_484729 [Mucor mucedo]
MTPVKMSSSHKVTKISPKDVLITKTFLEKTCDNLYLEIMQEASPPLSPMSPPECEIPGPRLTENASLNSTKMVNDNQVPIMEILVILEDLQKQHFNAEANIRHSHRQLAILIINQAHEKFLLKNNKLNYSRFRSILVKSQVPLSISRSRPFMKTLQALDPWSR